ncbi:MULTISPECIES: efflux RND transporter periplasmic adaptor subunit [unclassified Methylobacter]|uniref:efflux RND transporter periplasmic adaptor subunit n=1 Tax=unclassified Methylobacter TaxID=2635283 RepID=UPI002F93B937
MNKQTVITAILMLALGAGGGYWLASRQMVHEQSAVAPAAPKKPLFYRNPMNPDVTSPVPAKDSMGMDYVPVYAEEEEAAEKPGTVKIDPATTQDIGVRTAKASRQTLSQEIRAVGRVAYDEERIVRLHPKTEGWIEKMSVDKTGQWVKKNTDLLSIYSPQLVASQQEYVLALKNLEVLKQSPIAEIRRGAEELVNSSRERLKLLDVPEHQLHDLTHTHEIKKSLHIHTPAAGIVIEIGAREGQYVTPATQLYMIADLSKVWVYADIYEYELPWVKEGDPVEMRLAGIPGKVFKGHLAFIYPYAEAKTRTIKVRLVFDNAELLLKPDMFAEVTIQAGRRQEALVVPTEAVVRSSAGDRVFVVKGEGRFEPRTVRLGLASNGHVEIREGLAEGEAVVTSAQFLIDSESNLREATGKMMAPEPSQQAPHQHD